MPLIHYLGTERAKDPNANLKAREMTEVAYFNRKHQYGNDAVWLTRFRVQPSLPQ